MTRARDVANLIGSGNYSSTTFAATAGQTVFSIAHTQNFVQVFMNGLLLDLTADYTSNGSAVTLTSGAAAGDEIEVVAYNTFSVGDALNQAAADTRYVNTSGDTMSGDLTIDTNTFHVDVADNRVGVGTTTPYKPLTISSAIGGSKSDLLDLQSSNAGGGTQPMVRFGTEAANSNTLGRIGFIDIPNYGGGFVVETNSTGGATHTTTEKFRVDKDGRVTTPSQPAFKAHLTSTQNNVTGNGAIQSSSYAWTSFFNIGNHFSSGTFTAPVSGTYLFAGHWATLGTSMGDASYHIFRINNSNSTMRASSGLSMFDPRSMEWDQNQVVFGGTGIFYLSANDAVTMYGGNLDSGSNDVDVIGGTNWNTTIFSGYLIG